MVDWTNFGQALALAAGLETAEPGQTEPNPPTFEDIKAIVQTMSAKELAALEGTVGGKVAEFAQAALVNETYEALESVAYSMIGSQTPNNILTEDLQTKLGISVDGIFQDETATSVIDFMARTTDHPSFEAMSTDVRLSNLLNTQAPTEYQAFLAEQQTAATNAVSEPAATSLQADTQSALQASLDEANAQLFGLCVGETVDTELGKDFGPPLQPYDEATALIANLETKVAQSVWENCATRLETSSEPAVRDALAAAGVEFQEAIEGRVTEELASVREAHEQTLRGDITPAQESLLTELGEAGEDVNTLRAKLLEQATTHQAEMDAVNGSLEGSVKQCFEMVTGDVDQQAMTAENLDPDINIDVETTRIVDAVVDEVVSVCTAHQALPAETQASVIEGLREGITPDIRQGVVRHAQALEVNENIQAMESMEGILNQPEATTGLDADVLPRPGNNP